METALATLIVGSAVLSLVKLVTSTTQQSSYTQKITTGLMLASQIREMMADLPFCDPYNGVDTSGPDVGETTVAQYNDVEDFNGYTACPPIDAHRQPITGLPDWRQVVTVTLVGDNSGNTLNGVVNNLGAVVERVKVVVSYRTPGGNNWQPVASSVWLKTKY